MEQEKVKKKNVFTRGMSKIKHWWNGGVKGKGVVVLVALICMICTQGIYAVTFEGNQKNDANHQGQERDKLMPLEEVTNVVDLDNESKSYIETCIESTYTDISSLVLDTNVISIDFNSPEELFNKGSVSNGIYKLDDKGTVYVRYEDGSRILKDYLLECEIDIKSGLWTNLLVIDGVIDTNKEYAEIEEMRNQNINKESEEVDQAINNDNNSEVDINNQDGNDSSLVVDSNNQGNSDENISQAIDKYEYSSDIEGIVIDLVGKEIGALPNSSCITNIEFTESSDSYVSSGSMNGEIFELNSSFYFDYTWDYQDMIGLVDTGEFNIRLKYDVINKVILDCGVDLNVTFRGYF